MHQSGCPHYPDLPYSQQVEIDDVCDRFERALRAGQNPDVQEFVRSSSADSRVPLLRELMAVEHDFRRGDLRAIQTEYAHKFPELRLAIEAGVVHHGHDIQTGSQLGVFRIEREIGVGGMGIVYEAHDTKLGRTVALKLLPRHFAHDEQRLARFQREAKVLAGLNHPNIATLHEFGEHEGVQFLVLEFVPGGTLSQIQGDRAMPTGEIVRVFVQIAEALESAHEVGVVHRDLKPANVKLTPDGLVKVLDFGLARSIPDHAADIVDESRHADQGAADSMADTSKTSAQASRTTGISGTLPYMSPEQANGRPVDKRSDVWSYGCCLYEALAGQRAFSGQTATEVASAIGERAPDWKLLRHDTPRQLERLLKRCLAKDPRQRLRDIGDARLELVDCQFQAHVEKDAKQQARRQLQLRSVILVLSTALLSAVLSGAAIWILLSPRGQPRNTARTRSSVNLLSGAELAGRVPVAISPDGSQWAYIAAGDDGVRHVYVRARNSAEDRKLGGTEFAESPFFSPDGQRVAFFAGDSLKTTSISGGAPTIVCRAGFFQGGCWSADHGIVFSWDWGASLDQVSPDGSTRRSLIGDVTGRTGWPQSLPHGEILFVSNGKVLLTSLSPIGKANSHPHVRVIELIRKVDFARYTSTGHLLYTSRGNLFAVPFALSSKRVTGAEMLVADDVVTHATGADVAVSESGDIAYAPGAPTDTGELVWVSRASNETKAAWRGSGKYGSFKISPDGKQLAIGVDEDDGFNVWIYDFETGNRSLLTPEGQSERPIWTPDGKRVVFRWERDGDSGLYWTAPDAKAGPELLTASHKNSTPVCFSDDGKKLIFYSGESGTRGDVCELSMETHAVTPLVSSPDQNEAFGDLSPDGQWLAYLSSSANREFEVFVGRYPEMNEKYRISRSGGLDPMWSRSDDNTIFYWQGNIPSGRVMAATIAFDPFQVVSIEPAVAEKSIDIPGYAYDYDPKHDRFLIVRPSGEITPRTEFRLLQNSLGP